MLWSLKQIMRFWEKLFFLLEKFCLFLLAQGHEWIEKIGALARFHPGHVDECGCTSWQHKRSPKDSWKAIELSFHHAPSPDPSWCRAGKDGDLSSDILAHSFPTWSIWSYKHRTQDFALFWNKLLFVFFLLQLKIHPPFLLLKLCFLKEDQSSPNPSIVCYPSTDCTFMYGILDCHGN